MSESQASILTESQRKYLRDGTKLDGGEISNPYEYDKNIRKRVSRSLFDLLILFKHWEQDELRDVFSKPFAEISYHEGSNGEENPYCNACGEYVESVNHDCPARKQEADWYATAPGAFAFLTWALNVDDEMIYPPYEANQPAFDNFSDALEDGVSKYLAEKHNLVAGVSVSIELSDVDRLEELYPSED